MSTIVTMASNSSSNDTVTTIESWLKDLRMECYRRNLETYPDFQSLVFAKDADLKKHGIQNARDRSTMINSLSTFAYQLPRLNPKSLEGFGSKTIKEQNSESRSIFKKGKPINKLKGLLHGGQKKTKKTTEVLITSPKLSLEETDSKDTTAAVELSQSFSATTSSNNRRLSVSIEDLLKNIESQQQAVDSPQRCLAVDNDYVPDPQGSPLSSHVPVQRSYTISDTRYSKKERSFSPPSSTSHLRPMTVNYSDYPHRVGTSVADRCHNSDDEFDHLSPHEDAGTGNFSFEENNSSSNESSKHLSVVSMESGLGLMCDSDDNFNGSLVLEEQPWFHGKMNRSGAEALLDEDGDFLVHENPTTEGAYTLSLLWEGRCYHILVNCDEVVMKGLGGVTIGYKYQFENGAFDSIPELIFNHLRYQIPISKDLEAVIRHPVCKQGSKGSHYNSSEHTSKNRTLPKNFSYSVHKNRVISPEFFSSTEDSVDKNGTLRNLRSASFSPADSPRGSPLRDLSKTTVTGVSSSNSNMLCVVSDIPDEDEASDMVLKSIYQDVPDSPTGGSRTDLTTTPLHEDNRSVDSLPNIADDDPYNTYDFPMPSANAGMRPRAKTENFQHYHQSISTMSDSSDYQQPRPYDPDDYEEMRSVSVFDTLPSSPVLSPKPSPKPSPKTSHKLFARLSSQDDDMDNQYAFLTPRNIMKPPTGPQPGVKYAEITFKRSNTVSADYQMVPKHIRGSKQTRVTYVTTKTIQEEIALANSQPQQQHYAHPPFISRHQPTLDRSTSISSVNVRPKKNKLPRQSSMDLLRPSRPASIISRKTIKCPQTIQDVPSFLKEFSNDEIAMHLTKADGVCFLLSPRPAEDPELWTNRVQGVSTDGIFIGLETLASAVEGVKLWKKLFHRHLSLSQLVVLCIIQVTEPVERAKVLKRWIELSQLLQSGTYANLFAFMSVMKGLESPQVTDLTRTWELLKSHYTDAYNVYEKQLKGMISALMEGASVYAIESLTIPAIQHLRKLYNEKESTPSTDLQGIMEDFTTRVTGLDGLHSIIKHTSDLATNARKRLSSYSFDTLLFDFFMQDIPRMHLQNIGTSSEDPLERYRRFNIVLDSLFHKIENP